MSTITTSHGASYLLHKEQISLINEDKTTQIYTKHDYLFKRLLETFFAEFIETFFPQLYEKIDFSRLAFLSEEILPRRYDGDKRILDIVAEVKEKETDCAIVVHVEPQSYVQTDFDERMLYYFIELRQKIKKPIIPIAIFSYNQLWDKDTIVIEALGDEVLRFNYRTIHLRKLSWRSFVKQENPVAAALLSKMGYSRKERVTVKVEFLRMLTKLKISKEEQNLLMQFFETYLQLTVKEEEKVMEKVSKFKEADEVFEIINPYEERGRKLGREEGRTEIALKMLNKGYSIELIMDVTELTAEQIERLKRNV